LQTIELDHLDDDNEAVKSAVAVYLGDAGKTTTAIKPNDSAALEILKSLVTESGTVNAALTLGHGGMICLMMKIQ
jgi:hypothetical protein